MTTENTDVADNTEQSSLELSDDEFMKLPDPEPEEETTPENTDKPPLEEDSSESDSDVQPVDEESPNDVEDNTDATADDDTTDGDGGSDETDATEDNEDDEPSKEEESTIDYKAEYEKLMAPFKANGKMIQVKNIEDSIQLQKMGANYQKKMVGLKPSLKTLKLLEKHDLVDPEKINYLIDLHNKNPEAIKKLLQDSKIDPLDIDMKSTSDYKPEQRTVSDTELELESVLENIQDSPKYNDTLNVITKMWDDASRNVAAANPEVIGVINNHMESGIYDKVMSAVDYERSLGRLNGVSDLDAYKRMGDALDSQGLLTPNTETNQQKPSSAKTTVDPKKEVERKSRKKAVSPTNAKTSQAQPKKDYDPLTMSDEEFLKLDKNLY